jgi:YfiH family protein
MIIPQWPAPNNVKALATEREFSNSLLVGNSSAPYASLNLGDHVQDNPRSVEANRQQLLSQMPHCEEIRWLSQIHGTDCLQADLIDNSYAADASFTQQKGLSCAVMTADCLPVLFCDLEGRQVAAAHAGWKGLAAGILLNTLKTFNQNGIDNQQVIAWLGPAISQRVFEVGPEVKHAFLTFENGDAWADESCFLQGQADRYFADLYRLARLQLEHAGISGVYGEAGACTYEDLDSAGEARFFSYRRQSITGRQASLIWLA